MGSHNNPPKICIIGAGFGGLGAAIQLRKQLNIDSFTIFDENHDIGGTWLVNTYPGCACDVPSHLYSYSFEPNPNWSKAYSPQKEIWEYLRNITEKHDLYPKIKLKHRVTCVEYQDKIGKWKASILDIEKNVEETHVFDILISGVGVVRVPKIPPQFDAFQGQKMHSARWDSSIKLEDKVVAIVGTGASAVQIIPEIVDKVKRLIVYQRQAAWVMPKLQIRFPDVVKWAFAHVPGLQWSFRNAIFWINEMSYSTFLAHSVMGKIAAKYGRLHLRRQVKDVELREKLTPTYQFGCKRITPSNDYYNAFGKTHVTLVTTKMKTVTKDSIVCEDGTCEKPDVLILATGYKVQDYFAPLKIIARGGEDLLRTWKESGPRCYYGTICNSAPNLFFIRGPNTGLGHNTALFIMEEQVNWMIHIIKEMLKQNAQTVTVKKCVEDEFCSYLHTSLKSTVWGAYDCGSWYADQHGRITVPWPKSLVSYHLQIKMVDFSNFDFE